MLPASLRTGTTMDTARSVVVMTRCLMGQAARGQPALMRRKRRSWKLVDFTTRPDRKAEPAQREIAPHHHCADSANQRAGQHIGWIVRGDDHPADRDQQGIN